MSSAQAKISKLGERGVTPMFVLVYHVFAYRKCVCVWWIVLLCCVVLSPWLNHCWLSAEKHTLHLPVIAPSFWFDLKLFDHAALCFSASQSTKSPFFGPF